MLSHNTLANYFKNIFNMVQHHGYRIQELEDMPVYEFGAFVTMLSHYLQQKEQESKSNGYF